MTTMITMITTITMLTLTSQVGWSPEPNNPQTVAPPQSTAATTTTTLATVTVSCHCLCLCYIFTIAYVKTAMSFINSRLSNAQINTYTDISVCYFFGFGTHPTKNHAKTENLQLAGKTRPANSFHDREKRRHLDLHCLRQSR